MRAYSIDLRERIIRAVAAGQPKAAVARTFGVGLATVKRYVAQRRATGSLAPRRHPGPRPRLRPADEPALRAQLAAAPDATLAEHCQRWAETRRVAVSVPTMHRAIARLGWTRKKSRCARVNKTPGRAPPGGRTWRPWTPSASCSSMRPARASR